MILTIIMILLAIILIAIYDSQDSLTLLINMH